MGVPGSLDMRGADDADHPPAYSANVSLPPVASSSAPEVTPTSPAPVARSKVARRPSPAPSPSQASLSPHSQVDSSPNHEPKPLPKIDFSKYAIPESQLTEDQTARIVHSTALTSDFQALKTLVDEQLSLPPLIQIRIVGKIKDKVEFDVKCNMMSQIRREYSPTWTYVKVLEKDEKGFRGGIEENVTPHPVGPGLEAWCGLFCEDASPHKSFTIKRAVESWNFEAFESRIRALIATTKFAGNVQITFPLAYSQVTIHTPNPPKKSSGVLSMFSSNKKKGVSRYEPVMAIWPYAIERGNTKTYAVQSEEAWWSEWKEAIRYAVLTKRRGWVTAEDQMEVAMDPFPEEANIK